MGTKATRARKLHLLRFIESAEFANWVIRISQKSLTLGTHHFAEVSLDERLITINPHKTMAQFVESVVHELLHVLYPKSREDTILRWEQAVISDMSPSEITKLLAVLFSKQRVVWDE